MINQFKRAERLSLLKEAWKFNREGLVPSHDRLIEMTRDYKQLGRVICNLLSNNQFVSFCFALDGVCTLRLCNRK